MIKVKHSKNENGIRKWERFLDTMGKYEVRAGWFDAKNASKAGLTDMGGITKGAKGLKGKKIPPRPFIKRAGDSAKKRVRTYLRAKMKEAMASSGVRSRDMLNDIGQIFVEEIQDSIDRRVRPALSKKSTIPIRQSRGNYSTKPLIDTGEMRNSVKYKVIGKTRKRKELQQVKGESLTLRTVIK